MNAFRIGALALACLTIAACAKDPIAKTRTDNPDIDLSLLFTVDGCKVYRFSDAGEHRYFTTCSGSVSWTEPEGKSRRSVEIPTGRAD